MFCWGALSARLERFDVTAPIIFVLAGLLLTHGPLAFLSFVPSHQLVKDLAEFTLALVLFSDASLVGLRGLRADAGLYARLLGVALPLTIGLGTLLALALMGGTTGWLALLVGAALAPTDAALGAGMISNPVIPARVRRLINVESGLNDGIATPFVSVALAGRRREARLPGTARPRPSPSLAWAFSSASPRAGRAARWSKAARRRGWVAEGFAGPAVLGLATCAYASAVALGGNGFISAFVGGLAFGTTGGRPGQSLVPFVEESGRPGVPAGLAGVRRYRGGTRDEHPDLADGALRGAQPHRRPDGPRHGRANRRAGSAGQPSPWWAGSAPGAGLGGLRLARARGTG